jgi:hypothetical protein
MVDLIVWVLPSRETVPEQNFISPIGRHRIAMVFGAITGQLAAVAIDRLRVTLI